MDISEVAVVGLGTMGAGIAEVFARAGLAVAIEVDPGALERGMATLDRSLARAVTRGKLTEPEKADILRRVRPATGFAAAADADLAVESYGDPAFAPAPLLAEHAAAGLAFG